MLDSPSTASRPTLLSAAWRYRWLVVVVTAFVVALGLLIQVLRPQVDTFQAEATVVIQEPVTTDALTEGQRANLQFITSQVEIMSSPLVAEEASVLLAESDVDISAGEILATLEILSSPTSPLVTIFAEHSDPETAAAIANAVAEGYRQTSQRQATATANSQLARLDAQIEAIDDRLTEIQDELQELQVDDPALSEIESQAKEAVELIAERQEELGSASPEEAEAIRLEIEDLRNRIAVFEQVIASPIGPEVRALNEEEAGQAARRAQLLTLRDQIAIDAELAPDALALVQPATSAVRVQGVGASRVLAVSLLLGAGLGIAVSYFLATSRRTLRRREEPEELLGVPLLADVPDFHAEGLDSLVPVRDYARSAAAEAYRFAASSIETVARGAGVRSVFAVSSTLGHGKTTTVVNTAAAAATRGASVLVIDCDFGNQEASRLLIGDHHTELPGVTEVIEGVVEIDRAVHRVELGEGIALSVMTRGTRPGLAASALQSAAASELFSIAGQGYDMIFIDGPPLLQVAYATTLAQLADGLVVVVEHESAHRELNDLTSRLELLGKPVLGYVYNRSPLRREMTMSEGSMMDILGDSGMIDTPYRRERVKPR